MSEWQRFRQIITDLKTISVQTLVDGHPPLAIASSWDLLEGDAQTQIDAALVTPAGAAMRAQHTLDLQASEAVRGQWVALFRAWADLEETAQAAQAAEPDAADEDSEDADGEDA